MTSIAEVQRDPRIRDEGLKRRFAAMWVQRPQLPYPLICEIIGTNGPYLNQLTIACYSVWLTDPVVTAEMEKIRAAQGEAALLPSKERIALEILEVTRSARTASEKLNGFKLYAEIMGLNPKNNASVGVNLYSNKVLVVHDKGGEDEWSASLMQQQSSLVTEAQADIDAAGTKH